MKRLAEFAAPDVVAVAGPNGAGKATVGARLLEQTLRIRQFVNADDIARGLSGFAPESAAFEAGRVMLRRMGDLARRRETFAFETTLSGRGHARLIGELVATGYTFHLIYLWLESPELALQRVADRVRRGGTLRCRGGRAQALSPWAAELPGALPAVGDHVEGLR